MKLSVLVGVLVEFERAKAQQFFDDVIWTMPVIKNQTLEAKIETLKKQQEKAGFFGKEKYMEDYYKEIATGKKTTIHQNLESLKSEEEVTKKLDERKHRWLEDTKLMWKDLCHMNFELLNAKDQQAVVDFCPKADKCFIPMKNNVKYPNGEKDHIGQPKTPARPREISKTEVINDFVECIQYRCECPDYQENGWPVGKEVRGEKKYSVAGESLGYSKCWLFARRIGWRFQENALKESFFGIFEEYFFKAEKPPRACWIQFNDQCIPENVFYTVIEGSDIKPNTTCPNNNIINALDKLAQNETVASSSLSRSIEIVFSLIFIIALSL